MGQRGPRRRDHHLVAAAPAGQRQRLRLAAERAAARRLLAADGRGARLLPRAAQAAADGRHPTNAALLYQPRRRPGERGPAAPAQGRWCRFHCCRCVLACLRCCLRTLLAAWCATCVSQRAGTLTAAELYLGNCADSFKGTNRDSERTLDEMLSKKIAQRLELKVGAQVVLLRNLSDVLANGSRGVVVALAAAAPGAPVRPTVRFDSGVSATLEPSEFFQGSGGGSLTRCVSAMRAARLSPHLPPRPLLTTGACAGTYAPLRIAATSYR